MDTTHVIDLTSAAQVALTRMLDTGRVIGHDETGRRVIAVAVDDWVLDWFTSPDTLLPDGQGCPKERSARPRTR
jgi:hypothetical protein